MRRRKEPKDMFRWRIRNAYGIALGIMLVGGVFVFVWGTPYFFGVPDHISESRMGTRHVSAQDPGSEADRLGMHIGLGLVAVGILTAIGTQIVHMVFGLRSGAHRQRRPRRRPRR